MFRVKRIKDGEIVQVLDTYLDSIFGLTYFLVWENNGWRWRPANKYCPPNYDEKEKMNNG